MNINTNKLKADIFEEVQDKVDSIFLKYQGEEYAENEDAEDDG